MHHWKSLLKGDPTGWLLEKDNPSVRYLALKDLLERNGNDREVREAKQQIMRAGVVPMILAKQQKEGYWGTPKNFYSDKYGGTVWQLIVLAELGADGRDERIQKACDFMLKRSQDRQSGGFSELGSGTSGGSHGHILPCLTGNMVWSLIRFGHLEDPRVQRGINWIVNYQRFDDGAQEELKGWPYDRQGHPHCWGYTGVKHVHACHMGVVKALKALAEIPANKRSKGVKSTIEVGSEYLLRHHIFKRSHDLNRVSNPSFLKFAFPLTWQTDALEMLEILTMLGYKDKRMLEAINLVISKQDDRGRWRLESFPSPQVSFHRSFGINIEQKGHSSKWITLNALRALKGFYS